MFFNTTFSRFLAILTSKNGSKIESFSLLFRKCRFCENRCFSLSKLLFFRFRASQNRSKIDTKTHSKKTSKKTFPKIDFGFHFGSPKPPKIHQKSKKNEKNRVEKKHKKKSPGPQRASNQKLANQAF